MRIDGTLESKIPPSKQAFSKTIYKIRLTGFKKLLELTIQTTYHNSDYGICCGYRLIAANGSSLQLPGSEEIISEFGRFKPNGTDAMMAPLPRVYLFVDLCTSMICSVRIAFGM